jgi:signal transduction histidine kinase
MLIDHEASHLIEVTSDGARINWQRDDYRMSDDEKDRILFTKDVNGTVWKAIDLSVPELFETFYFSLLWPSLLQLALIIILSVAMLLFVRREERLRLIAEANKENFLAVISHDLRTPITAINGSLDLIRNGHTGEISDTTKQYVEIAINNSRRLINLINDLLDLQKFESGHMTYEIKNELLTPLVENSIKANQSYLEMFTTRCRLQVGDDNLWVHVDDSRFDQAFSNLLSNAIKYGAKDDEIIISIDRVNKYARVSITDHGEGIPESRHEQVFQRYAQFGDAKSKHVSSTGLGLSIVKNIIEQQGGKVGFKSEEGKGSTFYIDLPVIKI